MGKVLVWVGIALAVWLVWRFVVLSQRRSGRAAQAGDDAAAPKAGDAGRDPQAGPTPELMMQCAVCGLHLPGSEARFAKGRVYCSDAHRDQDAASVRDGAGRGGDA